MNTAKDLGLEESTWTYRFMYQGHRYTLIKRVRTKAGKWYLRSILNGKLVKRALKTSVAAAAEKRAIADVIIPAIKGDWAHLEANKLRDDYAKLSKVIATYQDICVGRTAPLTVRNNVNSFRLVVRRGLGNDGLNNEKVDDMSSSVLSGKLVSGFEDWMAKQAVVDKRDLESNKRSVVGYLRQARSLFKATARPRYKELGVNLHLAGVTEFMDRAVEAPTKAARLAPARALVNKTFTGAKLLRNDDRPVYTAFLLGLCSLRRGEIAQMRWSWIVPHGERWAIQLPAEHTKSHKVRVVPIDGRVRQSLEEYRIERQVGLDLEEEQFVIPSPRLGQGGDNCRLRGQNVFKRLNTWMRDQGWKTNHTLHEMRALSLSWVRDGYGLDTAQSVAGHASNRTTQDSYVGDKGVHDVIITLPLEIENARK